LLLPSQYRSSRARPAQRATPVRLPSLGSTGGGYSRGDSLIWFPEPTSKMDYFGARQTIGVMAKAALDDRHRFETRQLAESICEGLDSKDYTSEYLALYHFFLQNTRYMRDPRRVELVRAPWILSKMLLSGHRPSVDCDDGATWLAAAIMSVGGKAEFVTVAFDDVFYDGQRQYSHVFDRALEPRSGGKIILDPVAAEKTPQMLRRVRAACVWPISA